MPGNFEILAVRNIQRYVEPLVDRRQNPIPANLVLLNRTPEVPRTDEEIEASHEGHIFAADVILDDEKAVVRTADVIETKTSKVPNIKIGVAITQTMANLLERINNRATLPGEPDVFRNYTGRKYADNIQSIRIRQEALLWQARVGNTAYNKLGVRFSGIDWGIPSYCKVTPSVLWSSTSATPITDMMTAPATVQQRHGKQYNRAEMSLKTFNYVVKTDEFKAQANLFSGRSFPTGSNPFANPQLTQNLLGQMLNMTVELRDESYEEQLNDGSTRFNRYMPENVVVLSNTADDNNAAALEFSNAIVTESMMMNLPGVNIIGATGGGGLQRGPMGYATVPPDLNPPNATLWAVYRGMPRRTDKVQSVNLTVW